MERGDLVPDDVIVGVIVERISTDEAADGFILDGFPRTLPQGEALDDAVREAGRELTAVLLFDVSDEEVIRRLERPAHLRREGPRLPRRVQPAEGGGRLRHRRVGALHPR